MIQTNFFCPCTFVSIKELEMSRYKLLVSIGSYLLGAIIGFIYYKFYGCNHGCAITSNPYLTMIFGALIIGNLLQFFEQLLIRKT
jgi:hypothetical protein